MKRHGIILGLLSLCVNLSTRAVSLDGTTTIKYEPTSYSFSNGDFARGFVWLNDGCSIPAGATVAMNIAHLAGPVNMNDTGTIVLEGDLPLSSNVTLSSGGIIDGQGNAVLLGGNLAIPTGKVLACASNTVIDGQGHTLTLEDGVPGGQILIDGPAGTSLTLRNMTIQGVKIYSDGTLGIGFGASPDQVLVLENVALQLSDLFYFVGGKLEIRNFVKVSGVFPSELRPALEPTLFIYLSSGDCSIKKNATLFLDTTVGFVYFPVDEQNNHIVMSAPSSRLFLNGTALFAPSSTGLQLTNGHLTVDHKTFLQSDGIASGGRPIQFGDGIKEHDLAIDMLPGATLEVTNAFFRYQNQK